MTFLKAVGRFCYDLIIGDDWKIAAAVAVALGAGLGLTAWVTASWRAPAIGIVLVAAFAVAVVLDTRQPRR